jgi:hypothetical protein
VEWRLSKNGKEREKIPVEGPAAANGLVVVMGGGLHEQQFAKMRSLQHAKANHHDMGQWHDMFTSLSQQFPSVSSTSP